MSSHPHVDRDGTIHIDGQPDTRILSWNPPLLVLERDGEVRRVFLAAGEKGGTFTIDGKSHPLPATSGAAAASAGGGEAPAGDLTAPMPGRVLEVLVAAGDTVTAGQRLLVLEAMKMETPVRAPHDGVVRALHVEAGSSVDPGQVLVEVEAAGDAS